MLLYKTKLIQRIVLAMGELPVWCVACLLVIATLGGNFDLNRLVNVTVLPSIPVVAVSLFLALPIIFTAHSRNKPIFDKYIFVATSAGLLFYAAVVLKMAVFTEGENYDAIWFKVLIIIFSIPVIAWACVIWREDFVCKFSVMCVCMATIWASIWMFRCDQEVCLQDSIPFGSAFSFYRVQLLGFFCAIYLWMINRGNAKGLLWLPFSIILLVACLGSLSKAAWLAAFAAVFVYVLVQFIWFSSKVALVVTGVFILGAFFSYENVGHALVQRLEHVSKGTGHTSQNMKLLGNDISKSAIMALNAINGNRDQLQNLPAESREALEDFSKHHIVLPDLSYRLRLLRAAWEGGSAAPWFGNGYYNFRYDGVNLYSKELEVYRYPHNVLAEVFYSSGMFGIFCLVLCMVLGVGAVLRGREKVINALPFLCVALGVFTGAIFGGDILDFALFWVVLILASAALSQPVIEKLPIQHNE